MSNKYYETEERVFFMEQFQLINIREMKENHHQANITVITITGKIH